MAPVADRGRRQLRIEDGTGCGSRTAPLLLSPGQLPHHSPFSPSRSGMPLPLHPHSMATPSLSTIRYKKNKKRANDDDDGGEVAAEERSRNSGLRVGARTIE
uniref:Uncharacterized protein n=1 Tax=Oryza nivara TaxID=4536 RepID=A0A0E0FQA4_ORYNI